MEERQRISEMQEKAAGDVMREIREIEALRSESVEGIYTITAGCSEFLTIICC